MHRSNVKYFLHLKRNSYFKVYFYCLNVQNLLCHFISLNYVILRSCILKLHYTESMHKNQYIKIAYATVKFYKFHKRLYRKLLLKTGIK